MLGVDRDGHGVHPHRGAFTGDVIAEDHRFAGGIGGALGLGHVAAVAEGQAQVAIDQVGHWLRLELADVRPYLEQQLTGRRQVFTLGAARVAAQVVEHHGEDFIRRVDQRDAAIGEFGRVLRLEQQVEAVDRRIRHALLDLLGVVGQADRAPSVGHRGFVRVDVMGAQFLQARLDVAHGVELGGVQGLQTAGAHQALGHGIAGEDQVVAAAAGHQLGFQGFAAIHHVVDHPDTGLGGEFGQGVGGEIVSPVVELEGFILCRGADTRHDQRTTQ